MDRFLFLILLVRVCTHRLLNLNFLLIKSANILNSLILCTHSSPFSEVIAPFAMNYLPRDDWELECVWSINYSCLLIKPSKTFQMLLDFKWEVKRWDVMRCDEMRRWCYREVIGIIAPSREWDFSSLETHSTSFFETFHLILLFSFWTMPIPTDCPLFNTIFNSFWRWRDSLKFLTKCFHYAERV